MAWFKLLLGAALALSRAHPFEAANRNKSCNFIKATKAATREMRWRDCCQLDGYYYCYYSFCPWQRTAVDFQVWISAAVMQYQKRYPKSIILDADCCETHFAVDSA